MFKLEINDKEIYEAFKEMEAMPDEAAEEIINNLAVVAHNTARDLVPVDTGALKQSITLEVVKEDGGYAAYIGSDLEYAPDVEYGIKGRPQPFLNPAADRAMNELPKIQQAVLKKYGK